MSKRRYYGCKPKTEFHYTVLHENKGVVGSEIHFTYLNGRCSLTQIFYGSEMEYERSRDGEVELIDSFDEENTKLLMLRTGTKNGRELVEAMYERFHKEGAMAVHKIREWCDKKGIKHSFQSWP